MDDSVEVLTGQSSIFTWTADLAQQLIVQVRMPLIDAGWLLYLGGSVMYRGYSHNDLDLLALPRMESADPVQLENVLIRRGWEPMDEVKYRGRSIRKWHVGNRRVELVVVTSLQEGTEP